MMKIIGWMLIRMVAIRYFAILFGISFFVLSLDVLTNAKDIQALSPGHSMILLDYMMYRAPAVCANYMGISMLLAYWALPALGVQAFVHEIAHAVGVMVPVFTSYLGHKHFSFR